MTKTNGVRQLAGVTGAALTGALFFFIIVGVFGLQFAIARLLVFAVIVVAIHRAFPEGGATLVTPVVLGYSAFAYWIFRGRTPERGWEQ